MALLTPLSLAEASEIGAAYGLDVASVQPLRAGSVNSNFRLETPAGEGYFLRVYEEQGKSGAARELRTIAELERLGVPTPAPLRQRGGGHVSEHSGKPVGIHPWIEGEILCLGQITPRVTQELGRALARVHACTAALTEIPEGRFRVPDLLARLDHVDRTDGRFEADTRWIRERLVRYSGLVDAAGGLPHGLIHGDLFRDNVLWREGELVALLDFESASRGVLAYDIMVCVHAWCYGERYDLELAAGLLEGYAQVRRLDALEWNMLLPLGGLAALRFATTRITDFSLRAPPGQAPLRDYRRFLGRLRALEAGALDSIISKERS